MEDRSLDKNAVIGFVLIFAIMLGWLYFNQPTPEEIEAQRLEKETAESLVQSTSAQVKPEDNLPSESRDPILSDQARFEAYSMQVGAFAYTRSADSVMELQTDQFRAKFSTRGAELSELVLLDHQDYEGNQVRLIDADFSNFGLNFRTRDNRLIDTSELLFTATQEVIGSETKIIFRAAIDAQSFLEYTYTFKDSSYLIDLSIRTQNLSSYIAISDPVNLQWEYWAARNDQSVEYENRYTRLTYSYDTGTVKKLSATSDSDEEVAQNVDWVSNRHHFFSAILGSKKPFNEVRMRSENLVEEESKAIKYTKKYTTEAPLTLIGGEINESLYLYMGPTDANSMAAHKDLGIIDSIPFGWGIFGTLNRYVFNPFFDALAGVFPYGIAIIVMTLVVRLVLSPVTYKSYVSQAKMKVIQPEVQEINKKYESNAMKKQQETMKLYSKAGVNPMSGCVPALLQLPIFYALFSFFPTAFSLRQKSFLWVDDLSSYDTIVDLPFTIPFYGDHISLFPILASVAIFFYMQMTTGQTMQMQQQPGMPNMKFIMYLSPVMMLFFFNNYASGLSLYYFVSNLLTIAIMLIIKKFIIDENKIHLQVQQNKENPKKEGKFQRKMREMMEQAENQKKLGK
jgi:YidC/Oxa1 family membrane protein insertase